jgi:hypothetical protein
MVQALEGHQAPDDEGHGRGDGRFPRPNNRVLDELPRVGSDQLVHAIRRDPARLDTFMVLYDLLRVVSPPGFVSRPPQVVYPGP